MYNRFRDYSTDFLEVDGHDWHEDSGMWYNMNKYQGKRMRRFESVWKVDKTKGLYTKFARREE